MYKNDIHLFFTIVNTASHLIALKKIYVIRFFLFVPITFQEALYDDPSDRTQDPLVKDYVYDKYRTFIKDEDTIHSSLKPPLKLKPLHLIFVKTTRGVCWKFFHPHDYVINND